MTDEPRRAREAVIDEDRHGQRLDNFLLRELGQVPRALVYRLIRSGQVRVNGGRVKPMRKLAAGDRVRIPPVRIDQPPPARLPIELIERIRSSIVHRQAEYMVIDKPSGLAVQGGTGLAFGLNDLVARIEPEAVPAHRLDRETSGLIVFAIGRRSAAELQRAFVEQRIEKRYLALLDGHLSDDRIDVDQPLRKIRDASGQHRVVIDAEGSQARSSFRLLRRFARHDFVEVRIETGRTHQIRVHAQYLGAPIAGDARYNALPAPVGLRRLFLHAGYLRLKWPEEQVFSAPLPADLGRVLDQLK
ncbi:MAG: RluA family pseudouridine synthase [Wenzhouxiangellaceae bacterium]|nr:RluA family pseudouridine synthase [Wenzhouxiangellaceae bacterium]